VLGLSGSWEKIREKLGELSRSTISLTPEQIEFRSEQVVDGLFVDIEGTLVKDGELNVSLVGYLERLAFERNVIIFSGGELKKYMEFLEGKLNFPHSFNQKSAFAGCRLQEVIDDEGPKVLRQRYMIFPEMCIHPDEIK
jgi:hypothetical protein